VRKSIIALSTIMLAIGTFLVYIGLRAYLFPQVRGQFMAGGAVAVYGTLMIVIAGILILLSVTSKPKEMRSPTFGED